MLDLSRQEMYTLSHWFIGTEHLLWGLANEGTLTSFLTPLGITPERIHAGIVFIYDRQLQQGQVTPVQPPDKSVDTLKLLTPRTQQVIVLAGEEARNRGEQGIRPTHLLLGMMNEGEGIGAGLLRSLGISLLQARTALTTPQATQSCSFCGRSGTQVARLFPPELGIAENSISPNISICDQCVRRFHAMLETAPTEKQP